MKKIGSVVLLMVLVTGSCTNHFEDMNSDPNNLVDVPATSLFSWVILQTCSREAGAFNCPHSWAQQWSYCCYKDDDRYGSQVFELNPDKDYTDILINLEIIITKISEDISREKEVGKNTALLAAAKIMRVLNFHRVTDQVGDIPYSEALQGLDDDEIITPVFDTQESIYMDLLDELEEANELLDLSKVSGFGTGDLFFGGDPGKWKKLCNSLRLRILNRCAGTPWSFTYDMVGTGPFIATEGPAAYPGADAEIAAILNDPAGYPVMSGNEDNLQLVYPVDDVRRDAYIQPVYATFYTRTPFVMAETLVDWLVARDDPRIHMYAAPTMNYVNGNSPDPYVGEQNGSPLISVDEPKISYIGPRICKDPTAPFFLMTHDEVEFIKAEYYLRQDNGTAAKEAYESGIKFSMERWGCMDGSTVSAEYFSGGEKITYPLTQEVNYEAYLDHSLVDWDAAATKGEKFQLILEQKWATSFTQGYQAWHETRRTGFPARIFEYEYYATAYPDLGMPVRMTYQETGQNTENLALAKKQQNIEETNEGLFSTDGIKSQMWWHTRKNPVPTETDPPEIWDIY